MAAINRGLLTVWVYSEEGRIMAVLTTSTGGDIVIGNNYLLIYTASAVDGLEMDDWSSIIDALMDFCEAAGYDQIVAYSSVERVIEIFEEHGGDTEQRFCVLPVTEEY